MKFLISFIAIIFCSLVVKSQVEKIKSIPPGTYNISTSKERKIYGYFKIKSDSSFLYFGISSSGMSNRANTQYISFQQGKWKIREDGYYQAWVDFKMPKDLFAVNDSLVYNSSNSLNVDSCYFKISVLDKNGQPVKMAVIALNSYGDRLYAVNDSGQLIKQFQRNYKIPTILVMEPESHYPTTIALDSGYNFYELKIYLKKIPEEKGLLINNTFTPLNIVSKLNYDNNKILIKDYHVMFPDNYLVLTNSVQNEFEAYLQEIIKSNPQLKSYLENVRTKFYP